ncbi:MAG: class A beta-lactamase-related serine hydrolase [Ruminiclostridium sp.]|nr:class A beta-lactamase-related serine hydrolase [Ruminiclostridium sp.]
MASGPAQAVQQKELQSSPASCAEESGLNELKLMLVGYIGQQQGKYGLYYINLVTGEEFGINERDEYIAASTTKLPMNMLLYSEIEAGRIDPNGILTYSEEDFEPGTGVIQESDFGTLYTVREAAKLSIIHSDNCAMNMIIRILGIDNIRHYMQEIGGTIYYGDSHRSCPYDLAVYAAELYRFYEESPDIAEILIDDLQKTAWNDRINKYLPKEIKVAHKIGNYPKVYNDVGIVFTPKPYVIAVMSENVEQATAFDVIATISKMIYDYVE